MKHKSQYSGAAKIQGPCVTQKDRRESFEPWSAGWEDTFPAMTARGSVNDQPIPGKLTADNSSGSRPDSAGNSNMLR